MYKNVKFIDNFTFSHTHSIVKMHLEMFTRLKYKTEVLNKFHACV